MEMEENLDDIFDLKPILPEIYSNSDIHATRINRGKTKNWNSYHHPQEISIITNPSFSSSSSAAAAAGGSSGGATAQLISFENSNTSSTYPPTNSNNYSNLERSMAKDYYSLTPQIINFSSTLDEDEDLSGNNLYQDAVEMSHKRVCTTARTPLQAQDHLIAERKRREKLGQLFISLSKLVPGLKKLDKASLLEDAIKYLKGLQERVNILEEEEMKKSSMDDEESCVGNNNGSINISELYSAPPEIKARILNKHVLIKICCNKQMGIISRIPSEVEKMDLSVLDMRVMPFGGAAALHITILAQMNSEFRGAVKDIVDHLQMVFLNPRNQEDNYLN